MKLTHRPTRLPGADPETDRTVFLGGCAIARVRLVESGQQAGLWQWSCL